MLTFPFRVLHPLKAPTDYSNYVKEVTRLYNYLDKKKDAVNENEIIFMAIGAAMEEVYYEDKQQWFDYQYKQLFPDYLLNCIINNQKVMVTIIVVAPNRSFKEKIDLLFTKYVDDSILKNVKINVFYTMFPYYNKKYTRNMSKLSDSFNNLNNGWHNPYERLIATKKDKIFVKKYYDILDTLFCNIEKNGGCVLVNNYATFKNNIGGGLNYMLAKQITKLFGANKNRLLCEWKFDPKSTILDIYGTKKKISYDDENSLSCKLEITCSNELSLDITFNVI